MMNKINSLRSIFSCFLLFLLSTVMGQIGNNIVINPANAPRYQPGAPVFKNYKIDVTKVYRFQNPVTGKSIETEDGLINKGSRIQQYRGYTSNGVVDGHNQEWIFLPSGTVTARGNLQLPVVRILNYGFLKYLVAFNFGHGAGEYKPQLDFAPDNEGIDGDDGLWEVIPDAIWQTIRLRSLSTGLFLQFPNNNDDGTEMELATGSNDPRQRILYTLFIGLIPKPSITAPLAPCVLVPANSQSMNLSIANCSPEPETLLQLGTKDNHSICQQFTFNYVAKKDNAAHFTYSLVQLAPVLSTNLSVKLQNNTLLNGGNISVGGTIADSLTFWIMIDAVREPGKYMFFNMMSGKCMEVWNSGTSAGASIGQNLFKNGENQKWLIQKAN